MKRLYTLGDSFMSVDSPDDGITSFLELYAQRRGFAHVSLARPGATNFAIRLQIDRAIEEHADYVIVGVTSPDRFDIVVGNTHSNFKLTDIDYTKYRVQSKTDDAADVVSDTFNNIKDNAYLTVSTNQIQALKGYFTYLHDNFLQSQKDYYMISDGLQRLERAGIDYLLIPTWLKQHNWSWVKRTWPTGVPSPYDLPYGPDNWYPSPKFTNTHNPDYAHQEFCNVLDQITPDWC